MKTINLLLIVFTITLFSCNTKVKTETVKDPPKEIVAKTVYENLGGAEGISVIVDDIVDLHIKNEHIKHYFIPLQKDSVYFNQFKQHVKDFLASGTGGQEKYTGRDMSGTHANLNLSEADFLYAIDDILLVLDTHKIDRAARNEVLAVLFSLKWSIIKQ